MISPKLIIDKLAVSKHKFKVRIRFYYIEQESLRKAIDNIVESIFSFDERLYQECLHDSYRETGLSLFEFNESNLINKIDTLVQSKFINEEIATKFKINFSINKVRTINLFCKYFDNLINKLTSRKYFGIIHSQLTNEQYRIEGVKNIYFKLEKMNVLFGRGWCLSPEHLMHLDIKEIKRLEKTLAGYNFIEMIAEYIGRFNKSQKDFEEKLMKVIRNKYSPKIKQPSPEDISGIKYGNTLSIVLPHQLAMRNNKSSKSLFKLNYIERKLVELKQESNTIDEVETKEVISVPKQNKRGPFILCIDTSGSMHGEPALIAKAFAMLLVDIAMKEKRKCYLITFSVNIQTIDISDIKNNYQKFINFMTSDFCGGTDIEPALKESIVKTASSEYSNADVVVVSDMEFGSTLNELIKPIEESKQNGTRFLALVVGRIRSTDSTHDVFDKLWIFDHSKESIDKIIKSLNE